MNQSLFVVNTHLKGTTNTFKNLETVLAPLETAPLAAPDRKTGIVLNLQKSHWNSLSTPNADLKFKPGRQNKFTYLANHAKN